MAFGSHDFDRLTDGVIDLILEQKEPAEPARGRVPAYHYKLTIAGSGGKIGSIRLRAREHPALLFAGHIGYEVDQRPRGHHFAARARRLLPPLALAHGLERLIITCDPANIGSRRTCERIGAMFAGVWDVPAGHEMYQKGIRTVCRYEWILAPKGSAVPPSSASRPNGPTDVR